MNLINELKARELDLAKNCYILDTCAAPRTDPYRSGGSFVVKVKFRALGSGISNPKGSEAGLCVVSCRSPRGEVRSSLGGRASRVQRGRRRYAKRKEMRGGERNAMEHAIQILS